MKKRFAGLFAEFLRSEQSGGIILLACTVISILLANSPLRDEYLGFWHTKFGLEVGNFVFVQTVQHWINDGLMTLFFLLIGLEIERELYVGELSDRKNAFLPILAAVGGMATPALIHFVLNRGTATQGGIGIPIATDIAFALGVLSLLGTKIPLQLKVFLAALAIIDDLGAIVVIALFYVADFSGGYFLGAAAIFGLLLALNRLGVNRLPFYLLPGLLLWYFLLRSGVHATLAGVLLAFAIPFRRGDGDSPSYRLQHSLHRPVAFAIVPLFVIANTGVVFTSDWFAGLITFNSLGIFLGLFAGKATGITLFSYLAVRSGLTRLPAGVSWKQIIGTGFLGGIGFTMSIFITLLAFENPDIVQSSKISILLTSLLAGGVGYWVLKTESNRIGAR